jgi:hypothetical protein
MAIRETLRSLWTQIENNRLRSTSGQYFVPRSSLSTIFTPSAIEKAVAELKCEPEEHIGLAKAVQDEGIVTFAILVWIHQEDAIIMFRAHGALDDRLPLSEEPARLISPDFGATFAREAQWQFLPYIFRRNMANQHLEIEAERILPFVRELEPQVVGGFGTVFKEEIYPSLQEFYPEKVSSGDSAPGFPRQLSATTYYYVGSASSRGAKETSSAWIW